MPARSTSRHRGELKTAYTRARAKRRRQSRTPAPTPPTSAAASRSSPHDHAFRRPTMTALEPSAKSRTSPTMDRKRRRPLAQPRHSRASASCAGDESRQARASSPSPPTSCPRTEGFRLEYHWDLERPAARLPFNLVGKSIDSIYDLCEAVDWIEREIHEEFAIDFTGREYEPLSAARTWRHTPA